MLAATPFDHASLEAALRAAAGRLGLKAGPMFQPIRVAVCGRKNAPPLFQTMEVLGRDVCLERISQAIELQCQVRYSSAIIVDCLHVKECES